jgi:hypothetical protein
VPTINLEKTRCENCGQQALDTDVVCWQCGRPLPGREEAAPERLPVKESWQQDLSVSSVAMAVGMTVIVIVIALLLMRSLGQQPLVQVRFNTRTPPGYTVIHSGDRAFTLALPESWRWIDAGEPGGPAELDALLQAENRYALATHPAGADLEDVTPVFIAQGEPAAGEIEPPFVVLAWSRQLNRLSYEELQAYLENQPEIVTETRYVDDYAKSHLSADVRLAGQDPGPERLRCRQQIVLGEAQALLLSMCGQADRFGANQALFDNIAAGFQRLTA